MAEQFICVRMVQMRGVDLQQFQFDFDLTWAALFLRADGTIYGRYGSRDDQGPMSRNSIEGLQLTMERVLAAHKAFPANRADFAAKRGPKQPYASPEKIPAPFMKRITSQPTSSKNCIHCHNVYDAQHELLVSKGEYDPEKLWKYPLPENIGIEVSNATGTKILAVADDSPASSAKLESGDVIVKANGQAILSLADLQFVLHFLPPGQPLKLLVQTKRSNGKLEERLLPLADERFGDWRRGSIAWRGSMYGMPPKPGLWVEASNNRALPIPENRLALKVRGLFGNAVRKSKLKNGDVIIELDGKRDFLTPAQFHQQLRLRHYRPGSVMSLKVLRRREELAVDVKL